MTRHAAVATQIHDDDRLRITRFDFAPGSETAWHTHEFDYVVTPVTDCSMLLELPDGTTQEAEVKAGEAYHRTSGAEHNVINNGSAPMTFVEVELK